MKNSKVFNLAIASTVAASGIVTMVPAQADAALTFSDVLDTNTHYDAIMELADRDVISGFPDGTFGPSKSVTRGQAAKIIVGLLDLDTTNLENPEFKDVPTSHQYYDAIAALYNADIISGYENGNFGPSDTLTRGQMAKIITLAFNLEGTTELPFTDIPANSSYIPYIEALYANEVTTGTTETTYSPSNKVTRGQLASFVIRAEKTLEETVGTVQTIDATITELVDGKVIVDGAEYEVAPELVGVFSAQNAEALVNADVQLVVEYAPETVASLSPVVAKMKGKITGLKKLKLVQQNTAFNAQGFEIPELIIAAKAITVQEVISTLLIILENASVKLEKSTIAKVDTAIADAITVDEASKVEETVVTPPVEVTPEPKPTPSTGGSVTVTQTALDKVVGSAVNRINEKTGDVYLTFTASTNVIEVTVINGGTTVASIREKLSKEADGLTLVNLLTDLSIAEAGSIIANVAIVTLLAGSYTQTENIDAYISGMLAVDREKVVKDADTFIDGAIKASNVAVTDLADVKETFANNIQIKAGSETYTVVVK